MPTAQTFVAHVTKEGTLQEGSPGLQQRIEVETELERVHPRFAAISVEAGNTYGHPREEFLPGWVQPTSDLPTDLEGAATFYRDGTTVVPSHAPAEVH